MCRLTILDKVLAKICQSGIFSVMLIIVYAKQEKNDEKRQRLVFECAQCGRVFDEITTAFLGSRLFRSARDKDKALLKFVSNLNDLENETTKSRFSLDNLKDFLCFCKK